MLKIFQISLVLFAFTMSPAIASTSIEKYVPSAEKVGEGRLRLYMMNIYDAALFAPKGDYKDGQPLALEISYLRSISGKKIADRSRDEIIDQGRWSDEQIKSWHAKMLEIFPDVKDGDDITGIMSKDGTTIFTKAGQEIGRVEDQKFGEAFFDIWLREGTSSPDLRKKLLGQMAQAK